MTHPGGRSDHHAGAADVGPPAQVDVLAVVAHRRVEPTERSEQVGAHEEAGRGDGEHVGDGVVLLLINLADIDPAGRVAEAIDVEPDVFENASVLPRHELGSNNAGVRAVQLLDHRPHGIRIERDVVVAEAEEAVVTFYKLGDGVGRRTEPGIRWQLFDDRFGEDAGNAPRDAVFSAVGDEENGSQRRVVLMGEGLDALVEPRSRCVDDHDGDDGGRGDGARSLSAFAVHGGLRLAVPADRPVTELTTLRNIVVIRVGRRVCLQ